VLRRAIRRRGSTIRNYVGGSGLAGGYQKEFRAYGRTGEPCHRCETAIQCVRLAGRSNPLLPLLPARGGRRTQKTIPIQRHFDQLCRIVHSSVYWARRAWSGSAAFLFGAGILVLITASFWLYAFRMESLAYEQTNPMGRLLVNWLITKQHLQHLSLKKWEWDQLVQEEMPEEGRPQPPALGSREWKKAPRRTGRFVGKAPTRGCSKLPREHHQAQSPQSHQSARGERIGSAQRIPVRRYQERIQPSSAGEGSHQYYGAVRATNRCLSCHPATAEEKEAYGELKEKT